MFVSFNLLNQENKRGDANTGGQWERDGAGGGGGIYLNISHFTSKIITTAVNLTSTSCRRNATEHADVITSITLRLLTETPQSFGQKRNFPLGVIFYSVERGTAALLHICIDVTSPPPVHTGGFLQHS